MAETGKTLHRFASLGLKSRIDAALRCGVGLQAKRFFFAATKLESDADLVAATAVAGETILLCGDED